MNHKLYLVLFLAVLFNGCNGVTGTWKNERIDDDLRKEISALNDKLFNGIINNDSAAVKVLLSKDLLAKDGDKIGNYLKQMNSSFKADSYRIMDEYYMKNSSEGFSASLNKADLSDNDYTIQYKALHREMYISFLLPKEQQHDFLITAVYGKSGDEWKLDIIHFGAYTLFGKTAPEYYKLAKESYENSRYVDAVDYLSLADYILKPAQDFFKFNKEEEITAFSKMVLDEVKTKFPLPMRLDNIEGRPEIFKIYPVVAEKSFVPELMYLSKINLSDTIALKKEYEKIKVEVERIFPGINDDKEYVHYKAFNEMPGQRSVSHYLFVDKSTAPNRVE